MTMSRSGAAGASLPDRGDAPATAGATAGSLTVIYAAVALDVVGIGLIIPILPELLTTILGRSDVGLEVGILGTAYAVMQFLFAPFLGSLSDRFGRRPVLLISIAGAAVDYILMALAPQLWVLIVGRLLAGICGANIAVAQAYITDVTPPEMRSQRFGIFGAMIGLGFVIGPALGGLLGDWMLRLPFVAAAILNGCNFLFAYFILAESRAPDRDLSDTATIDPVRPFRWALARRELFPVLVVWFFLSAGRAAYATCWALWGRDTFGWSGALIGASLAVLGLFQAPVQIWLSSSAARRFGEKRTAAIGIAITCVSLIALAFAGVGWLVFAVLPIFALGNIANPAFQTLATRFVGPGEQGRLQGVLASAASLASILGPLGFAALYTAFHRSWPGAVWLCVAMLWALALPFVAAIQSRFQPPTKHGEA